MAQYRDGMWAEGTRQKGGLEARNKEILKGGGKRTKGEREKTKGNKHAYRESSGAVGEGYGESVQQVGQR